MPQYHLRKRVAKNIRKFRFQMKLTQERAAEFSDLHYKYYQRIESGIVNLTLDSLEKISKALKVDPNDLLS